MKTINTILIIFFIILTQNSNAQCWSQIAAGEYHTLAIKSDGTLWAWGNNDKGQLGNGTTINKSIPTQIGSDTDWIAVDAAGSNSMALKSNGTLWAWGNNNFGQIGDGNHGSGVFNSQPTQIGSDNDWVKFEIKSFAIKSNGTLWGWGYNLDGRLGTGDNLPHYTPIQIGSDNDWVDVNSGANNSIALKSNGTIWGWGMNKSGSLAIGEPSETFIITTPTQTGNNTSDWLRIEVGSPASSKIIKTDGSLWAMGYNADGNIGNNSLVDVNAPTRIGLDNDWNKVSTNYFTCAIKNNGTLWSWGANMQGQLGDGTTVNKSVPTQVGIGILWKEVKTGLQHTVAISDDHTLYAWGYNNKGQLGDGTLQDRTAITQIGNACPLGVTDFKTFNAFRAVPNPTNNQTVVHFFAQAATYFTVIVSNVLGQTVAEKTGQSTFGENREFIDLNAFSAGVYYITINTTGQQNVLKVVKK